jgi:DNA-binding MarR family transcriptional regulator
LLTSRLRYAVTVAQEQRQVSGGEQRIDAGQQQAHGGVSARLADQVCFALYSASHAVTGYYRPMLDELGLTYPQYLVMLALWQRDDLAMKELSAMLYLDSGTLSPLLKRLEQRKLVRRARSAEDERSVIITLTDAGKALRGRATGVPAAIQTAMDLDDDQLEALRTELRALADAVRSAPPTQLP